MEEVTRQLNGAVYYGNESPKATKDIIVLDLNLRSVLSRGTIEAALDNLLRDQYYQQCSYFTDETTCGSRNRQALLNPQVRERLVRLLSAAGYTTRHISMRDLQGFLSYLIFAGASCDELSKHEREGFDFRYYNLCFSGDGELFRAINELFDPVRTTIPETDEHLWENTGVFDGWVFARPPLTPDHYEDAWEQFRAIKRQYYFEHRDGGSLLERSYEDDRVFQELVSSKGDTDQKYLGTVLEAINRFYCQTLPDEQEYLRLWGSQVYDTHTPPVLVSCYRVEKQKFSLDTPQLAPWLRDALDFKPGHLMLRYRSDAGEASLRIDRGLWKALMQARRGIPMGLRSPQYSQLLQSFMTRLHRYEAEAAEVQNLVVFNSVRDRVHEIAVDRTKGRYIAR